LSAVNFSNDHTLIIAEVAQAHDGSLGFAHAFVDAVANAGADAIKFQTHIASAESTPAEPWRVKFSKQDETRYDYWKRMEFTEAQWHGLAEHAQVCGLKFLSSPFSVEAVELLLKVGVPAWKIASGEVSNIHMFNRILETNLPILLSSGMSPVHEIDAVVAQIKARHVPLVVMQCTTAYPCPPEKIGLNLIPFFRERYECGVGLSDHSGTIYPGLAAVTLGIQALEVHVTLSREMFGPDVPASITTSELSQVVEGARFIEKMLTNPVDKDEVAGQMVPLRNLFTKSIVARHSLAAGIVLRDTDLVVKKPGTGIAAERMSDFIGRKLVRALMVDEQLKQTDVEWS